MKRRLIVLLSLLGGCAAPERRFANRAILWHDPDSAPVPRPPRRHDAEINWEGIRDTVFRPTDRVLAMKYSGESKNVNALDEVPDSTWFVNRRRDPASPDDQPRWQPLDPETVARGAAVQPPPHPPFTVLNEKSDGSSDGIVVRDACGVKYLFKLDPLGYPGLISAIEVVATRLAWAAGWNVASDTVLDVQSEELVLASDAWSKDRLGRKRPFSRERLDELLAHSASSLTADPTQPKSVRVAASRWIEGDVLGWFSYLGRDKHDPNDRVPHQDRRDLRGFGVWAAWVNDIDTFDNNTLDSYVGEPGRGYVLHYEQGVGASFGRFAGKPSEYWMGQEPYFTPGSLLTSVASLGLVHRPWEDRELKRARAKLMVEWPEFGFFDVEHFNPRHWRPVVENPAFVRQTKRDRYWGAKQIVAFTPEEIRAAISAGQYRPAAAEHLFEVLWRRREKIARAFFSDVAPLDHFQLRADQLCFEDLWISAGLGGEANTRYQAHEESGEVRGQRGEVALAVGGNRCLTLPLSAGYHVVTLRAQRPGERRFGPAVRVHLIDGRMRHIVGVER